MLHPQSSNPDLQLTVVYSSGTPCLGAPLMSKVVCIFLATRRYPGWNVLGQQDLLMQSAIDHPSTCRRWVVVLVEEFSLFPLLKLSFICRQLFDVNE